MKSLTVYLAFPGTCEEAMNFYKNCFGGELTFSTFADSPMEVPDDFKTKIMHSDLTCDGMTIMACDMTPDRPVTHGNSVSISVSLDNEDEQTAIFDTLKDGANVLMELQDTFWNARFGMLIDKYGFTWMLNVQRPHPQAWLPFMK